MINIITRSVKLCNKEMMKNAQLQITHQLCKSTVINNKFQSNRPFKSHNTHFFLRFIQFVMQKSQ